MRMNHSATAARSVFLAALVLVPLQAHASGGFGLLEMLYIGILLFAWPLLLMGLIYLTWRFLARKGASGAAPAIPFQLKVAFMILGTTSAYLLYSNIHSAYQMPTWQVGLVIAAVGALLVHQRFSRRRTDEKQPG